MKSTKFAALTLFLACAVGTAYAHHSGATYDSTKMVTVKGTVKEFEWSNPHAWLNVVVLNPSGQAEDWAFEMASPLQLTSHGWKKDTLKAGDQITIQAHPLKDGSHGGSYMSVTLPTGQVLGQRG